MEVPLKARLLDSIASTNEVSIEEYRCERCYRALTATNKMSIVKPPLIFVVRLKRYKEDTLLWIRRYTKDDKKIAIERELVINQTPLKLRMLINHSGSERGGHYTALAEFNN